MATLIVRKRGKAKRSRTARKYRHWRAQFVSRFPLVAIDIVIFSGKLTWLNAQLGLLNRFVL